jgi:hypothetical protein
MPGLEKYQTCGEVSIPDPGFQLIGLPPNVSFLQCWASTVSFDGRWDLPILQFQIKKTFKTNETMANSKATSVGNMIAN